MKLHTLHASGEKAKLCAEVIKGTPTVLAQQIMQVPYLRRCIPTLILESVDSKCRKLCVKIKGVPSVQIFVHQEKVRKI